MLLSICWEIWSRIGSWCKVGSIKFPSIRDLIESYANLGLNKIARKMFNALFLLRVDAFGKIGTRRYLSKL